MKVIVQKFGGSSVADAGKLESVARRVAETRAQGFSVVVVVSAMGKTTDALFKQALEIDNEPPQRELDMLVTAGERISMTLLTMAIKKLGIEAISFTGSQSGIITENRHQGARILEIKPHRIIEALESGRVVIVAGYQGVSREREVTTLGRGGSDTSAVAMAAALKAEICEIYSDVDGVYSADPRVCEQAQHLAEITFSEMQSMSDAGAKVLNAQAVDFARRAGIQIHALKAHSDTTRKTVVSQQTTSPASGDVRAVVGARALKVESAFDDRAALYRAMEGAGAQLHHAQSLDDCDSSVWLTAGMSGVKGGGLPTSLESTRIRASEVSTVTAVISGASLLNIDSGEKALHAEGIEPLRRNLTGSTWTWVVGREDEEKAVKILHALWCELKA